MKSVDEAVAQVAAAFAPIGEEKLALLSALGRHLSRAIDARHDAPPFDNSAMDGYALVAATIAGASREAPVSLRVEGESRAGGPPPPPLAAGAAQRIFTGAAMPVGADSVLLQEDTVRADDTIRVLEATRPGDHVRKRGSDLRVGQPMFAPGARLGAGELGLLASQDIASVAVYRRPRVAILSTGDELRDIGEPARPGSIVNSNGYMLAAQVLEAGAEPWLLPPVPDRRELATEAIRAGLRADVLVICGGVSVGEYDVVRDALADAGVVLDFWKVRMKPGKPLAFARAGTTPVLGLPGNPVSAWVTFELFVRPGLRRMLGDPQPDRVRAHVQLGTDLKRRPGRTEFLRARLHGGLAHPLPKQGSGSLPSIAQVDALVIVPAEATELAAGASLEAVLLR